jgi:hypothetical protein
MIISNVLFEYGTLFIILLNSLFLTIDDPTTDDTNTPLDLFFLSFYTLEMILKISAMGFALNKGAYLRDNWNILDFVIILFSYLPYLVESSVINFKVLRAFRVMRPLRTISSIKNLRLLLDALFEAIPLLKDAIIILLFFYMIFAIAGLQLFSGLLKKR